MSGIEPHDSVPHAADSQTHRDSLPDSSQASHLEPLDPLQLDWTAANQQHARDHRATSQLDRFLAEPDDVQAVRLWMGHLENVDHDTIVRRLNYDVAQIDQLINHQVNAILHHPKFQRLESSWRGVEYLARAAAEEADSSIKLRLLNVSWRELERDFERAAEFDQSQLFRKVYEEEFGMAGGTPFNCLIGDYQIHPRPAAGHPHDDLGVLAAISQVAAAAFCPFLTNAHPSLFGLDSFHELEHVLNHQRHFERPELLKWRSFRDREDSRFVGICLPRMLMRTPYEDDGSRQESFAFSEHVHAADGQQYLWGGAAWALGRILIRSFAQSGWLADIRGFKRDVDGGGLVTDLPVHCFATDSWGVAKKSSTDVMVTDTLERELSELGFIPLCDAHDSEFSVFFSNNSVQRPKRFDTNVATTNARISAMLQYMFCVSRFAHYIKVIARDKTGAFTEAEEFETLLHNWIVQFVTTDAEASQSVKARHPLRDANIQVRPFPGKPGSYQCVIHLSPHYELDDLTASVRLIAELPTKTAN